MGITMANKDLLGMFNYTFIRAHKYNKYTLILYMYPVYPDTIMHVLMVSM